MQYSFSILIVFQLNQYSTRIDAIEHVRRIYYKSGGTNTGAAIKLARIQMFTEASGDRPEAKNLMVIITGLDLC